jgi:hypothetical protein
MRKERWAAWSAAIAALSLTAALVFNGIQVHDSAVAQNQAKIATELGLLTQLQGAMKESLYSRVPYGPEFRRLRSEGPSALSPAAYRVMAEEVSNMDYFAWLFDKGYLTAPGADELWGPRMICEFKQVFAPGFQDPVYEAPDLYQFIVERPKLSRLAQHCQ